MLQSTTHYVQSKFNDFFRANPTAQEQQRLLSDEPGSSLITTEEPEDKASVVYWVFFLYGIAMLLPWNIFITASEFFFRRFRGSGYEGTFQNYFSTSFTISDLVIFTYLLWKQSRSTSYHTDVITPLSVNAAVFGIMAITIETDSSGSDYFWFTLLLLVITGVSTAFAQVAVFAEASCLPPKYMQAVMSGQGVSGVAVAIFSILSALVGSTDTTPDEEAVTRSAFLYFTTALVITLASLVGRFVIAKHPFYIYQKSSVVIQSSTEQLSDEESISQSDYVYSKDSISLVRVTRKSAGLIFTVGYVFVITLALFPSITALIKSVHRPEDNLVAAPSDRYRFFDDDLFVAFHFLLFNVGDWVGRTIPIIKCFQIFDTKKLAFMSLLRTLFIPLFLVCNVIVPEERGISVWVNSDTLYFLILWIFAVTNGWIGSLTMMAAPQQSFIKSNAEKSLVGNLMSFFLVFGLAMGGTFSFIIRYLV
ncbi:nucleoside transporter-domain-containing protein [Spinellus fusiger]|nr:nucleoside transporter-domain-containing protein [Spinellus fusiger]